MLQHIKKEGEVDPVENFVRARLALKSSQFAKVSVHSLSKFLGFLCSLESIHHIVNHPGEEGTKGGISFATQLNPVTGCNLSGGP